MPYSIFTEKGKSCFLYVVYPGRARYRLAEKTEVVPLTALLS
jgi:hypothetical protein